MSFHLPPQALTEPSDPFKDTPDPSSSGSEDEDDGAEETWDDWVEDEQRPCKSLFGEEVLPSATDALEHDRSAHGFDLGETCKRLGLDLYGRIRLINWIRKEKPTPAQVAELQSTADCLSSDAYLIPVLEDDPLLQIQPEDSDWSDDSDSENATQPQAEPTTLVDAAHAIHALQSKLRKAKQDLADYRTFVGERLDLKGVAEALKHGEDAGAGASGSAAVGTKAAAPLRDDDSHYFQSYGENDIHAVMIQDKVRTATYASYILSHPEVFRGATVLDVGCGTGILSLFAARAGAKRVLAVDASPVAEKAEEIVKANGFENVITVIRGKVEDISLPDSITQVDVIVSEWMGYALLYESMLDSVLVARDRFLKKEGGIMAPAQTQMMLGLCDGAEVYKERVKFWNDVYGFDMSAMAGDLYEDAVVDVVGPDSLVSDAVVIKDLTLLTTTPKNLSFSTPFTLSSTAVRRTTVRAFVLYFDTFFTPNGQPIAPGTEVHVVKEGDPVLAEVWQVGGKPHLSRRASSGDGLVRAAREREAREKVTSFSTGPRSTPTHWKQTLFMLREPIIVDEGYVVQGVFKCRKSEDNSRELDVEIHYSVKISADDEADEVVVQTFKVR